MKGIWYGWYYFECGNSSSNKETTEELLVQRQFFFLIFSFISGDMVYVLVFPIIETWSLTCDERWTLVLGKILFEEDQTGREVVLCCWSVFFVKEVDLLVWNTAGGEGNWSRDYGMSLVVVCKWQPVGLVFLFTGPIPVSYEERGLFAVGLLLQF